MNTTTNLLMLVRREFWEHRSLWIAPLVWAAESSSSCPRPFGRHSMQATASVLDRHRASRRSRV